VIRIARAMRLVSDDGLGNVGVKGHEMANEIMLAHVERYRRVGKRGKSRHEVRYHAGDVAHATALQAIVGVLVVVAMIRTSNDVNTVIGVCVVMILSRQRRYRRQLYQGTRIRPVENEGDRNQPDAKTVHRM
jgi:hypothetical protein